MNYGFNGRSDTQKFTRILLWVCVMLFITSMTSIVLTTIFGNGTIAYVLWLTCIIFYSSTGVYSRVANWITVQLNKFFEPKARIVA